MEQREIKFRAWLPCISKMTRPGTIEDITKWSPLGCTPVWLQFTGLKDRYGKDVYDGDILREYSVLENEEPRIIYIVWQDGGFMYRNSHESDFYTYQSHTGQCEIIGNIYEHPELLKTA